MDRERSRSSNFPAGFFSFPIFFSDFMNFTAIPGRAFLFLRYNAENGGDGQYIGQFVVAVAVAVWSALECTLLTFYFKVSRTFL
jgi:hypothetical protein